MSKFNSRPQTFNACEIKDVLLCWLGPASLTDPLTPTPTHPVPRRGGVVCRPTHRGGLTFPLLFGGGVLLQGITPGWGLNRELQGRWRGQRQVLDWVGVGRGYRPNTNDVEA